MFQILVPAGGRTQKKQEKNKLTKVYIISCHVQASIHIFAIALQKIPSPYF